MKIKIWCEEGTTKREMENFIGDAMNDYLYLSKRDFEEDNEDVECVSYKVTIKVEEN